MVGIPHYLIPVLGTPIWEDQVSVLAQLLVVLEDPEALVFLSLRQVLVVLGRPLVHLLLAIHLHQERLVVPYLLVDLVDLVDPAL